MLQLYYYKYYIGSTVLLSRSATLGCWGISFSFSFFLFFFFESVPKYTVYLNVTSLSGQV